MLWPHKHSQVGVGWQPAILAEDPGIRNKKGRHMSHVSHNSGLEGHLDLATNPVKETESGRSPSRAERG